MADGSVTFRLFGQDVSASKALQSVGRHAKQTARDLDNVDRASSRAGRSSFDLGQTMRAGLGSAASAGIRAVAAGFTALAAAAGAATAAIAVTGVKTAAFNEQAMISLNTLIGSADKAQEHFADLKEFAASTPFELPGLVEADRLMLGIGMRAQDVIPYLRLWGDTSAALGLSQEQFSRIMLANSQAMSASRYSIEDLNQITENGVPVYKLLSDALGKSVPQIREMATEGRLTTDVFSKLFPVMQKNYTGSMERQAQTLSGVWSTLKDTFSQGAADALVNGGAIDALKRAITDAMPMVERFFGWLGNVGIPNLMRISQTVGQSIGPALRDMGAYLSDNRETFVGLVNAFIALTRAAAPLISTLGPVLISSLEATLLVIQTLGRSLAAVLDLTASALDAVGRVLPGSMGASARNMAANVRAFAQQAKRDFDAISDPTINVHIRPVMYSSGLPGGSVYDQQVPGAAGAARRMTTTPVAKMGSGIPDLGYIGGGGGIGGAGGGAGAKAAETARKNAIKQVGKNLGKDFAKALLSSRADLARAFDTLMGNLAEAGDRQAKNIAKRARKRLLDLAKTHDRITAQLKKAQDKLRDLRRESASFMREVRDNIVESGNVASQPGSFGQITFNLNKALFRAKQFASVMSRLKAAGLDRTSMRQLMEAGPDALESAWSILNSGKGGISQIAELQKQLRAAGTAAGTTGSVALYDAGIKAADGLVKGLQKREGAIAKVMRRVARQMIRAIKKELGIRSPSKVAEGIGGYFGDGLIQGMAKKIPLVNATAAGMLDATVSGGYQAYRPPSVTAAVPTVNHFHFPGAVIGSESHIVRTVEAAQSRVSGQGRRR